MNPEDKGISKVLSYKSAKNGIEVEIVITTQSLKDKGNIDNKLTDTLNTIDAYFIHDNIMYSLVFWLPVYEYYESDRVTTTSPDPLTTDDYVTLMQNVIDAFILN